MTTCSRALRGGTMLILLAMAMMLLTSPVVAEAPKKCRANQMLDEVLITSVAAKESRIVWSAQGLLNFDAGGDIPNGLLEVTFQDLPTSFDFDGYVIEATASDDDPGTSLDLTEEDKFPNYKSEVIPRPSVPGSLFTRVLNLEPGTTYFVTVYAVNHNIVQISPSQKAQDARGATTLLSAPFPGALAGYAEGDSIEWTDVELGDKTGIHFATYGKEADEDSFRWLSPLHWGPWDHVTKKSASDTSKDGYRHSKGQADMLGLDKDGDLVSCDSPWRGLRAHALRNRNPEQQRKTLGAETGADFGRL